MSNFRFRLREATKILATGENDVKNRLQLACTSHLFLANIGPDEGVPDYFTIKLEEIIGKLTKKEWRVGNIKGDRLRATLHRMHRKTASKIATEVWILYTEYEAYMHGNFTIPDRNS